LAATLVVRWALAATVILVGLAGAYLFCVYIQHVSPGAFAAGLTLLIRRRPTSPSRWRRRRLFGLSAGMIACYKGISVGGGPAGVGNAVNENRWSSPSWRCSRSMWFANPPSRSR